MIAAVTASENGNEVTILEKMENIGKKLLITGKGRCNITNSADMEEFMKNIPENSKFLYSSFNKYTNQDIVSFLKKQGVETKVERGGRIFPVSDKAQDVLEAFKRRLKELKVQIRTNFEVAKILTEDGNVTGIEGKNGEKILADKVILATGGKSYPVTGSTGDGYRMAKMLGHTVTELKPSLVPLTTSGNSRILCQQMQGLSLKNVAIKIKNENKIIYEDFGEMLFTHYGVSGPVILSASAILIRYKNIDELLKENKIKLYIDLKPALDEEKKNKQFKNSLDKLLPRKMIEPIITLIGISPEKRINEITKKERRKIVKVLKNFELTISGFRSIEEAIVTKGGISIKEINPKTMESKIINGLYFAGEIIDLDAFTGGFNLQIAWSTGYSAGTN